jgi:uncharacterized Ntn-hydrolase superfamily protein
LSLERTASSVTFSICVRESYQDESGTEQTRFGVAVTTRLPGVGTLCPFATENGAVATQSLVNVDLGRKGIDYLDDGLAIDDALDALLAADEGAPQRQLHGVDAEDTFTFSGEECGDWFGHTAGENYTVAGNLLTGPEVIEAVATAYEATRHYEPTDRAEEGVAPLADRLIGALAAGHAEGGDKRERLPIQSAALRVETTEEYELEPFYDDLRVDATETPIEDLRETYELARRGYRDVMAESETEDADDEAVSALSPENGDEE